MRRRSKLCFRALYDVVPNVEMWELEKEMDKDGRVVFRLGWARREG